MIYCALSLTSPLQGIGRKFFCVSPDVFEVQVVYRFSINEIQITEVYTGVTAAIANGSLTSSFFAACGEDTGCSSADYEGTSVALPTATLNNNPLDGSAYISVVFNLEAANDFFPVDTTHFWSVVQEHVPDATSPDRNSFGSAIISHVPATFSFRILVGASNTNDPQGQLNAFIRNNTLLAYALSPSSVTITSTTIELNATVTVHRECYGCTDGSPQFALQFTPRECEDGFQGVCSTCAQCTEPTYRFVRLCEVVYVLYSRSLSTRMCAFFNADT